MFQEFYKHNQNEIVALIRQFVQNDFFGHFPKWKDKISILIEGSIANGRYDAFSDIDLMIALPKRFQKTYSMEEIKAYKKRLRDLKEPIQLHVPESYDAIILNLQDWTRDGKLREVSKSLIVVDPESKIKEIKKNFRWYPKSIFKEKLHWLFAEATFELKERFEIASKRQDIFFTECVKIRILRLLLNACLLANRRYPSFDKHLYGDVQSIQNVPERILSIASALIRTHEPEAVSKLFTQLFSEIEDYLIKKKLIKKQDSQYWIDLRPIYKVQFE